MKLKKFAEEKLIKEQVVTEVPTPGFNQRRKNRYVYASNMEDMEESYVRPQPKLDRRRSYEVTSNLNNSLFASKSPELKPQTSQTAKPTLRRNESLDLAQALWSPKLTGSQSELPEKPRADRKNRSFSILPPIQELPKSSRGSNRAFISPSKMKKKKKRLPNPLVKDDMCLDLKKKLKRERRDSLNGLDDLKATEGKLNFFQTKLLKKARKIKGSMKNKLKDYYDSLVEKRNQQKEQKQKKENLMKDMQDEKRKRTLGPWELLWGYKQEVLKKDSPYADFPSYRIRQLIIKGGDDLRQEMVTMQIIRKVKEIFEREKTQLYVHTYEIIAIDSNSGALGKLFLPRIHF